jgi:hypothetical protein
MEQKIKDKENSDPVVFSDSEVERIIITQQTIYALDDAISIMIAARRPETFINPLNNLRGAYAEDMKRITSKRNPSNENTETENKK